MNEQKHVIGDNRRGSIAATFDKRNRYAWLCLQTITGEIIINPQLALHLLAWLEQEQATLEQLAAENLAQLQADDEAREAAIAKMPVSKWEGKT